ncbi:MAG: hypothetical protein IT303_08835 [Dehalococcoidia bacterium]|nr:hypothetical protein [Dehalococcoidia bacterium]
MGSREKLHWLLDQIRDEDLDRAEHALGELQPDPMLRLLYTAPYDDEPYTEEERAVVESRIASGGGVSHEVVVAILDALCEEASGTARPYSSSSS